MKVHLHDEQFDGHMHAWCGRAGTAVDSDTFEATRPALRCSFCDREWFPNGQPDWHYKIAVALKAKPSEGFELNKVDEKR